MYTLRIVMPHMTENIVLGGTYAVTHKSDNADYFNEVCDRNEFNKETHHAIIFADETQREIPVLSQYEHYIMLNGKTVDNLSIPVKR